MTASWDARENEPDLDPVTPLGWVRVTLRGTLVIGLLLVGLLILLAIRLFERPLFGAARPITPYITRFVCRAVLMLLGIRFTTTGRPMRKPGAVVANHGSWLDIFALNARKNVYFVSKAEVAGWPGIGWLARATGTLFVERDRRRAAQQVKDFRARLSLGHKLLFFPEGTSSDTLRVLPFKATLFAAFLTPELRDITHIQPVTVRYVAPVGQDKRFYGWWGEMDLAPHVLQVLAVGRQGHITVMYHPPVRVSDFSDRKALAAYCEATIAAAQVV